MTLPDISLVTVTYNSSKVLENHWAGDLPADVEWIVVDNASSDGSAEVAKRLGARTLQLPRNIGFSGANNAGAAIAESTILIFVNPDVTVSAPGLYALRDLLRARDVVAAPQLLNVDGSLQENGRQAPYLARKFMHFFGSDASERHYEVTAEINEIKEAVWAIGAAVGIRRESFRRMGGWDSRYFIYYEDSDFCLRAMKDGIPTVIVGPARWVHGWARETKRSFNWSSWRHEIKSAARFYSRHPSLLLPPTRFSRWLKTEMAQTTQMVRGTPPR